MMKDRGVNDNVNCNVIGARVWSLENTGGKCQSSMVLCLFFRFRTKVSILGGIVVPQKEIK